MDKLGFVVRIFLLLLDKINKAFKSWENVYGCYSLSDVKKNSTGDSIFILPYFRCGWPHVD
jgi:hypothetical protein